jgi:RNA polymerase sigma-70 factor (ECF subfamily)
MATDDADRPESPAVGPASPTPMDAVLSAIPAADLRRTAMELLAREESVLRRVMGRYVHDVHAVDDLYQDLSLKVLRRLDSVRDPAALRGWVFQMARNACLDWLRRMDRQRTVAGETAIAERTASGDMGRNPVEQFLTHERVAAVRRAMDRLPDSQRETIRLRIEEGLDHEAIAARLGISRQAVEVRLCRGRAALKEQLDAIIGGDL